MVGAAIQTQLYLSSRPKVLVKLCQALKKKKINCLDVEESMIATENLYQVMESQKLVTLEENNCLLSDFP